MEQHHNTPGTRETYEYYRLPAPYDMVISLSRTHPHLPRMESGLLSTLYADLTRSHLIFMNHFHSYQYCFPFFPPYSPARGRAEQNQRHRHRHSTICSAVSWLLTRISSEPRCMYSVHIIVYLIPSRDYFIYFISFFFFPRYRYTVCVRT